jgi:hypothetical protein
MTANFRLQDPGHEAVRRLLLERHGGSQARCAQFTREFQLRFPDLRRVAGFYYAADSDWCYGEHWWCEDVHGKVIDPTGDQFPCQGTGRYVKYDPHQHKVVKGKCMNCGTGLFSREGTYACSQACAHDLFTEYGWRVQGPFEVDMDFSCDADLVLKHGMKFSDPRLMRLALPT